MRRFWILLRTEFKAWRRDPITALGGFVAPTIILVAFGLLLSGELSFPIAVINHDRGPAGTALVDTFDEVNSPFGQPYYQILDLTEGEAWEAYNTQRLDAVWVIPADFSERLETGQQPRIEMHYNNYIDDRAKNHRIYSAEILWRFYETIGQPGPPLAMVEEYPLPEMVSWFWVIGTGVVLLGVTLGGMFNIFMLTYREQITRITLEFGLSPRPMVGILLPKIVLALLMGLLTGTVIMGILYLWVGIWPGHFLGAVYLLCGLVAVFWISLAMVLGLRARHYMAGAITAIFVGVIAFFVGGGMAPARYYPEGVQRIAQFFPNTHAIDPLRDMILFHTWPSNWTWTLLILLAFATGGLAAGIASTNHQLRRLG